MKARSARPVGEILQAAQQRAKYLRKQALPSEPTEAAKMIGDAAKELQLLFEELPNRSYREAGVADLVMQAVTLRDIAHQFHLESGSPFNAAHEQGYAAHCLESYAQPLVKQKIKGPVMGEDTPVDILDRALHLRYRAIELFRSRPISFGALALELSYTSKSLDFLRESVAGFRTPEIVSRIISFRCEAASLFEDRCEYNEANYQYFYLMRVFEKLAKEDPRYYVQLAKSAVRAGRTCEEGKLRLSWWIGAYRKAAWAYGRAASWSRGEDSEYYTRRAGEMIERIERVRKKLPRQ